MNILIDGGALEVKNFILSVDRIDFPIYIKIDDGVNNAVVFMSEPFECCGKVYLHEFSATHKTSLRQLFEFCELAATNRGYSYIGFVHVSDTIYTQVAEELGYKVAVNFQNKRSGNELLEMYKLL